MNDNNTSANSNSQVIELLKSVKENNFKLYLDDSDTLKLDTYERELSDEMKGQIITLKDDLILFLKSQKSYTKVHKVSEKSHYTLSSAQRRLYFLYEFDKESIAYNLPQVVQMEGHLDRKKLEQAFEKLILRHESLRTYFELIEDEVVQKISPTVDFDIAYYEAEHADAESIIKGFIRPFNLSEAPLIRVGLIRISAEVHLLMVDMHHIITDGTSSGILIKDFMALYIGQELSEVALQYKDYAEWQQAPEQQARHARQKNFWLQEYEEEVSVLDLPIDFPRPQVKSQAGSSKNFTVGKHEVENLRALGDRVGSTMFMTVLSLFNVLLSRLSNQEDIVVGISTAGREHADLEGVIGMFVTPLPVRNYPKSELSFEAFLSNVKTKAWSCFDNQSYQYEELIEELNITRDTSRNPLFDVMFAFQNFDGEALNIPDLALKPYKSGHNIAKFDIELGAVESADELFVNLEYSTDLFTEKTIDRFITYFKRIISSVAQDATKRLSEIDILSSEEKTWLLKECNDTSVGYPQGMTILDLFDAQVADNPDHEALIFGSQMLSYESFGKKVNQAANHLTSEGITKGDVIGLMSGLSMNLMVHVYAIMKVGGVYLPLDKSYPQERINYILTNSGAKTVICQEQDKHIIDSTINLIFLDTEKNDQSNEYDGPVLSNEDIAYIIYTSGSTGHPKGVKISHSSFYNYINFAKETYTTSEPCPMALFTSISFDLTITSMFLPMVTGNSLHIYGSDSGELPVQNVLLEKRAKVLKLTPSHLKALVESEADFTTIETLIVGGEMFDKNLATQVFDLAGSHIKIYNEYGPTEATVGCVVYQFNPEDSFVGSSLLIGKPIANTSIYILDSCNNVQPIGVPGELCIGGTGLSAGYLNNEALTKEKFIANPFHEEQLIYKTGDLAKWLPDGNMALLGREDDQVKIRGYRIELGEIESQIKNHAEINEVTVTAKEKKGEKHLVAYYVSPKEVNLTALRNYLSEQLPDYMIPAHFIPLDSLPLTANGKLDYKSLPDPEPTSTYVAPRTDEEKLLCEVWSTVLGLEKIGIMDNFFAVGGDSIRSIQICSRMKRAGYKLTVQDVITSQTIEALTQHLKPLAVKTTEPNIVKGEVPLTGIQHWFFDGDIDSKHHFNQSVMLNFPNGILEAEVRQIFEELQNHHDNLRMVFKQDGKSIIQEYKSSGQPLSLTLHDLREDRDPENRIVDFCNDLQSDIDLESGPLMKLGLYEMSDGTRLLMVIHHLVIDGISWRILFEDIETLYQQLKNQEALKLPAKTDSFQLWSEQLKLYIQSNSYEQSVKYWNSISGKDEVIISRDMPKGSNTSSDLVTTGFRLSSTNTKKLLKDVHNTFNTQINDILLTALVMSIGEKYGSGALKLDMEGHGREEIVGNVDVSRTIGWFTSIYPILLEQSEGNFARIIKSVKEALRHIPNNGIDYLIAKYMDANSPILDSSQESSRISFNYLGQFDSDTEKKSYHIAKESTGNNASLLETRHYDWDISGMISGGQLNISLSFSDKQYERTTIDNLMGSYETHLIEVINYCCNYGKQELTPSDLTYSDLTIPQLEGLQENYDLQDVYPLSPMQEGMLYHALLNEHADHYFEQMSYRLQGELDIVSMSQSLQGLVDRYDILRTVFVNDGYDRSLQVVQKEGSVDFNFVDISEEVGKSDRDKVLDSYRISDRDKKFTLSKGALMRVTVYQTGMNDYEFVWSHHHILMDGWCMSIIINEFSALYNGIRMGTQVELPSVQPYSSYIGWLESKDKSTSEAYWQDYLLDYNSLTTLPANDLLSRESGMKKSQNVLLLSESQTQILQGLTSKYRVTLNTIIQTVWGILLSRYNNTNDVVFGAVVSGRPAEVEGIEDMVGLFINTIPVRISYDDELSISDLLLQVQEKAIASEDHHYSPLSEIQSVSELGMGLLDHIMVFENYPVTKEVEGIEKNREKTNTYSVTNVEIFEQTNYDFSIVILPGERLEISFHYNANTYDNSTVALIKGHFTTIIEQLVLDCEMLVSELPILTSHEQKELLDTFNDSSQDYDRDKTIGELFEAQVQRTPNDIALIHHGETLSYQELNNRINQLAIALREEGINRNMIVAIMLDRSFNMIVAIIATIKAGAAYLPIDSDYPDSRKAYILENSAASILLVDSEESETLDGFSGKVINVGKVEFCDKIIPNISGVNISSDLFYAIYTSGSTGSPKGAMLKHSNLTNLINFDYHGTNIVFDNILQFTTLSFDPSFQEIFSALLKGGKLTLIDQADITDFDRLFEVIRENQVTTLFMPASILSPIFDEEYYLNKVPESIRHIITAGEQIIIGENFKRYLREHKVHLHNHYGPAETQVVTGYMIKPEDEIPTRPCIGKPIFNTQIYILNKSMALQPVNVVGELYIGGEQLGLGYLNNEHLTAEKFIDNPFIPGDKLYTTGDLARWLPDGNIEFLGRTDDQIKIRGIRIELGEIESSLLGHSAVRETAVMAKETGGEKFLVSYYVSNHEVEPAELREYLSERLPDYMLPSHYVYMEHFPVTPNGKLDRRALPNPEFEAGNSYVAPSGDLEDKLVEIWAEVLKIDPEIISVNKSFFELGGNSLKATVLVNKISKSLSIEFKLKDLFIKHSVKMQAEFIGLNNWLFFEETKDEEKVGITI